VLVSYFIIQVSSELLDQEALKSIPYEASMTLSPLNLQILIQVYRVPWRIDSIYFAMLVTGHSRKRKVSKDDTETRMKIGKRNLLNLQPSPHVIQVRGCL